MRCLVCELVLSQGYETLLSHILKMNLRLRNHPNIISAPNHCKQRDNVSLEKCESKAYTLKLNLLTLLSVCLIDFSNSSMTELTLLFST